MVENKIRTRCPHCQTLFRVSEAQLRAADGLVRCGRCLATFDGRAHLEESAAAPQSPSPPAAPTPPIPPPADPPGARARALVERLQLDGATLIAEAEQRAVSARGARRRLPWLAANLLLAALLPLQILYFNSLRFPPDSLPGRAAARLCPRLGCPLPQPEASPGAVVAAELVVRSHPAVAGALLVEATLLNAADVPRPFPPLTLSFEDLQGRIVGRRTFYPGEYLSPELRSLAAMPPRQPVRIELEIVDPGREALSFRLVPEA
ncbi:MAG: hypothetical protein KatS3mg124_1958 [Porticoccaceae bacterium]|nr:MAG: hypothetical protein KatS3mg124_1958 [Porticoccaceae bacterium]